MMLNWLTRYAPAMAALEEGGDPGSILDIGCGQHGLSCVRPDRRSSASTSSSPARPPRR